MYPWNDLVSRLRALKAKGTQAFENWKTIRLSQSRVIGAEREAKYARSRLTAVQAELVRTQEALRVTQKRDPLLEAQSLLEQVDYLLSNNPVTLAEVRTWRTEYKVYRMQNLRDRL
jgi:hypothetical protein